MGKPSEYDFSGWATKNDLECSDGLFIRKNAFAHCDGKVVPLFFNHNHDDVNAVLGNVYLENRDEGVYCYGTFNNSPSGQSAKEALRHGDIESLSIWANNLTTFGTDVRNGAIREVSLVPAGANPGALIESVLSHGVSISSEEDEAIIYCGEKIIAHSEDDKKPDDDKKTGEEEQESGKTMEEIYQSMDQDQKRFCAFMVEEAVSEINKALDDKNKKKEDENVSHSVFDKDKRDDKKKVLSHSEMKAIFKEARNRGSLKEVVLELAKSNEALAHTIDTTGMVTPKTTGQAYGINDISMLFPDYRNLNMPPEFISRNMTWVEKFLGAVHQTPFSRIRSLFADITEDEARAKGYIKGRQKKEEVFTTLKRTTSSTTVYKKQKLDRQDVVEITDFDVVAWIKSEMEMMLAEEVARAMLIGDGRPSDSDDKIPEDHIRPIAKDVPLFNTVVTVKTEAGADPSVKAKNTINAIIRARKNYKGSGNPIYWTTEDEVTEMLLIEDGIGHKLYKTLDELATALRVSEIVTVEPMEGTTISVNGEDLPLAGVIVNPKDYNVGKNKGGENTMFDDFDLNFNQYIYLLETMMSGALVKPFSALTVVHEEA